MHSPNTAIIRQVLQALENPEVQYEMISISIHSTDSIGQETGQIIKVSHIIIGFGGGKVVRLRRTHTGDTATTWRALGYDTEHPDPLWPILEALEG